MATNTTTTTTFVETTYDTPISYADISLLAGFDAQNQLAVFRKDIVSLVGQTLTTREYRELGTIPSSWLTIDEGTNTITDITVPGAATYTLENSSVVSIPAMSASEALIVYRKQVYSEPLVEWVTGTRLTAGQFNTNTAQLLGSIQELYDSMLLFARTDDPTYVPKAYVDGEIDTNVTDQLGAANGIATLDANGQIPLSQFSLGVGGFGGTFFTEETGPVWSSGGNEFDFGSLWYSLTSGRVYVWYPKTPSVPVDGQGFWVDISAPVLGT